MGSSFLDGLYQVYGTDLAIPTTAGDFMSPGEDRTIEFDINVADLTTSASIQANTTFVPADVFIDSVILIATTPVATITSLSVGLMQMDRTTTIADNAFADAVVVADLNAAGETKTLTGPATAGGAGTKVGTTVGSLPGYLTAKIAGSAGTGIVKVRIKYRGVPPITH